jgi:hypothetical protein
MYYVMPMSISHKTEQEVPRKSALLTATRNQIGLRHNPKKKIRKEKTQGYRLEIVLRVAPKALFARRP